MTPAIQVDIINTGILSDLKKYATGIDSKYVNFAAQGSCPTF